MTCLFIPTIADSATDLQKSLEHLEHLPKNYNKGLMFILRKGIKTLESTKKAQYKGLEILNDKIGRKQIIVMAPNLPLSGLNFYKFPERSIDYINGVIDFTYYLPNKAKNPIVSFHLNTLLDPEEAKNEATNFSIKLEKDILPALGKLSNYALGKNIKLVIETTPLPEFGDMDDPSLNTLVNPYPIYSKYYDLIRNVGIGIALDLCHTYVLLKKLELNKNLMDEVRQLRSGDVIHLNDSKGIFNPEKGTLHEEGVTLGEGEVEELPEIISYISNKELNIVFEINEKDYINRPNLLKSINYFKEYAFDKSKK